MNEEKEVYFDQYCKSCKCHGLKESKDPCNDCLAEPSNTNSHKPINYESKNNSWDRSLYSGVDRCGSHSEYRVP